MQEYYKYQSVMLTGPRATSISEIASLLQEHTGRKVNVRIVSPKEAIEYHKKRESISADQAWYLDNWASWLQGMEEGEVNIVDPTMEKLLGRKPRGIEEMVDELFKVNSTPLDTKDFDNYAK